VCAAEVIICLLISVSAPKVAATIIDEDTETELQRLGFKICSHYSSQNTAFPVLTFF
jgi:hypothetical protein